MAPTAPFADPSDVAAIWRPLSDAEQSLAAALIVEAAQLIQEIPAVAARLTAGLISDLTASSVVARMVRRVMLNPQNLRQFSTTVDDVTRSGTYESSGVPVGELMVSATDLDRLLGRVAASGAFSIVQPALLVAGSSSLVDQFPVSWPFPPDPSA